MKNSTLTKINPPDIAIITDELLPMEHRLAQKVNHDHIRLFGLYTTDIPLDITAENIDTVVLKEMFEFFNKEGFINDNNLANAYGFMPENVQQFKDWFGITSSTFEHIKAESFGNTAFGEYDYRIKDDEKAKAYIYNYGSLPEYEITEIDRRNELLEALAQLLDEKLASTPITHFQLIYNEYSHCDEVVHLWEAGNTLVAMSVYHRM